MTAPAPAREEFVIGRDVGGYGRVARVLAGAWLVLAGVGRVASTGLELVDVAAVAGYLVATTLVYTVAVYAFGDRVLARLNPWTGTTLLLVPIVAVGVLDATTQLPPALPAAVYIYVGLSLVLIGVAGYGGCEVAGLPVVVLRRRYTVYCAMNAVDAAERPLTRATSKPARLVGGIPVLLGGVYYFFVQTLLGLLGVDLPFDPRWPVLLFLPAIVLLARVALLGVRGTGWSAADGSIRSCGVGALGLAATAAGILVFGGILFAYLVLTGVILAAGIGSGIRQAAGRRLQHEISR